MAFSLIFGLQKAQKEQLLSQEITNNSFQMMMLQNEYLLHPYERTKNQWLSTHQRMLTDLNKGKEVFTADKEKTLFEEVLQVSLGNKALFDQLVFSVEQRKSDAFKEQAKDWLSIKAKERVSNMSVLSKISQEKASSTMYLLELLMFTLVGIMSAVSLWSYGIIRSMNKSLGKVNEGIKIIAGGNLDHKIDVESEDEFGKLSLLLNEMTLKLKELDGLKDNFLAVATHELKTPLVPIRAQSELLLAGDYGILNAKQKEAVEMIYRNENSLDFLTGQVFDIAKIKSNKLKLILGRTNLGKVVTDAVYDRKNIAEKKHISFSLLFTQEIPEMMLDEMRIRQIVVNLIDNAIKFTPENGTIEVELKKSGSDIILTVKDSGVGIDKINLEKVFSPFFQLETGSDRKYRGTGLGLAISKGITEAHGGKIQVKSEGLGKGSTFTVRLPITLS